MPPLRSIGARQTEHGLPLTNTHWCKHAQQKRCPHLVHTAFLASSKHMWHAHRESMLLSSVDSSAMAAYWKAHNPRAIWKEAKSLTNNEQSNNPDAFFIDPTKFDQVFIYTSNYTILTWLTICKEKNSQLTLHSEKKEMCTWSTSKVESDSLSMGASKVCWKLGLKMHDTWDVIYNVQVVWGTSKASSLNINFECLVRWRRLHHIIHNWLLAYYPHSILSLIH